MKSNAKSDKSDPCKMLGWFSTENHVAVEEIRIIAIVLVIITTLVVIFFIFKAYNSHMKTHVKNITTREVALNNAITTK